MYDTPASQGGQDGLLIMTAKGKLKQRYDTAFADGKEANLDLRETLITLAVLRCLQLAMCLAAGCLILGLVDRSAVALNFTSAALTVIKLVFMLLAPDRFFQRGRMVAIFDIITGALLIGAGVDLVNLVRGMPPSAEADKMRASYILSFAAAACFIPTGLILRNASKALHRVKKAKKTAAQLASVAGSPVVVASPGGPGGPTVIQMVPVDAAGAAGAAAGPIAPVVPPVDVDEKGEKAPPPYAQ